MGDRTLDALRRRLEKWELEHLRRLAAELQERLERAEEEASRAWESAEFWQRNAMDLQEALLEEDFTIGLTQGGELVPIPPESRTVREPYSTELRPCTCGADRKDDCSGGTTNPIPQPTPARRAVFIGTTNEPSDTKA